MNMLTSEIRRTLKELDLGLKVSGVVCARPTVCGGGLPGVRAHEHAHLRDTAHAQGAGPRAEGQWCSLCTPYVVVAFQECERMNMLTSEIRRTLKELDLGLKVSQNITV